MERSSSINRFRGHKRPGHDRSGRRRFALRAVIGAVLVFLTTGVASMHSHGAAQGAGASFSMTTLTAAGGGDAPGPFHGHQPADLVDCQICELTRRGEVEASVPSSRLFVEIDFEHSVVGVHELLSAPRAPTRGRPSPRGPPRSV